MTLVRVSGYYQAGHGGVLLLLRCDAVGFDVTNVHLHTIFEARYSTRVPGWAFILSKRSLNAVSTSCQCYTGLCFFWEPWSACAHRYMVYR